MLARRAVLGIAAVVALALLAGDLASGAGGDAEPLTTLVSRAGGEGKGGDANSTEPSISADGRYIAFVSRAKNLSPAAKNGQRQVYVRDLLAKTTTLVSRGAGQSAGEPSISGDGRYVAYRSGGQILVRDTAADTTELVSRASGAAGPAADEYSTAPSISADGRHVAFESNANNLSAEDADAITDVFVRDLDLAVTELVSRASGPAGTPSDNYSTEPSISADGRYVAFESDAKLTGQRGFGPNAFLRDTVGGTTKLVSVGDIPRAGNPDRNPSVSADGRYVAFQTQGNGVTEVDGANRVDVFVRDMQRGVTVDASRASGTLGVPGDGPSFNASISADGSFVAFDSRATNLSGSDDEAASDVFRRRPVYVEEKPLPQCEGRTATIIGTPGKDTIRGTKRADVILALGGDDRVRSFSAPDAICAGPGRDTVDAGGNGEHGGGDLVLGGPGDDRLILRPELGTLKGGPGNDELIGSRGGDALYGEAGDDVLRSGPAPPFNNDILYGGPGNDLLITGPGPDNVSPGPGRNVVR